MDAAEILPETDVAGARVLDASPDEVRRAFTDSARLERFWGPTGFTCTTEAFSPTPGGRWRIVMHGPDGKDYPNLWEYAGIEPERIVMRHLEPGHRFTVTVSLQEQDAGRTRCQWHQRFASAEEFDRPFITSVLEQIFDRLEAELARERR